MYLSNIEIVGFKSFADKSDFKFSPGLSALVGPNGCGKTNIVDAVRWVLGEKKASVLRSDVMENVIFNGTSNRKPMGMAEVTLILQNNRGILPTEYNEITISRRLYRSGESQYFLNKTQCRLKDITNLFMDTGLAADSYSVIELKMVEAILSGKVEDRRAMFEEAAGIKKYKIRRKEALRRLDQINQDLDRVKDILEEVRKNVNSLSRQAAKTKRYNKLMDELKTLETKLLLQEFFHISSEHNDIQKSIKEYLNNIKLKENEINKKNELADDIRLKLREAEHQYKSAQEKEKGIKAKIAADNQVLAVSAEKIKSSENNISRLEGEINNFNNEIKRFNLTVNNSKEKLEKVKNDFSDLAKLIDNKKDLNEKIRDEVKKLRNIVNKKNENLINTQSNLNSLKSQKARESDKKDSLTNRIIRLEEEKIKISNEIDEFNNELDNKSVTLPELEQELDGSKNYLEEQLEKKSSLQSTEEQLKIKLNEIINNLSNKKASVDFLNSITHANETSKFLLNHKEWRVGLKTYLLGEQIGTDDKYKVAIESILGEASNFIIAENRNDATDAIELLKKSNKGKASIICMDDIDNKNIPQPSENQNKYLYNLIRCDSKIKNILYSLFGKTYICEDGDEADELIRNGAERAVTPNGTIFTSFGVIKGGSSSDKEAVWVGKQEKIDILNSEINELENEKSNLQEEIEEIISEKENIDVISLKNEINDLQKKQDDLIQSISRLNLKVESSENKLQLTEENLLRFSEEIQELTSDDNEYNEKIELLESNIKILHSELEDAKKKLKSEETKLFSEEKNLRELELKSVSLNSEIKSLEKSINSGNHRINELNNLIDKKKNDIKTYQQNKEELSDKSTELEEELENLEIQANEYANELEYLTENKEKFSYKFEDADKEINKLRKEYDKLNNDYHQKDLLLNEKSIQLKNISNRLIENYEINPKEINISPDDDFNIEAEKENVSEIKNKLSSIGNINFMALEEYEEQSQRLEFYEKQLNDLEESEITLKDTIKEINTEAEKRFNETFEEIRTNFVKLFKKLFGDDGYADLKLSDDNPLEANIEIIAKPPFKKPHSIEMLSGGEKTLTAISLLFAIYLVKPSPFCILDEVDAPLDDSNISKFVKLIKDFSEETQFLIVTHNKKTMEAADTLYGITMQENGISKIVSVKFDDEEAA